MFNRTTAHAVRRWCNANK